MQERVFFKHEGDYKFKRKFGKYIYALYDDDDKNLRLYFIRLSNVSIVLGGGGYKDKLVKEREPVEMEKTKNKMLITARIDNIMNQKGLKKYQLAKKVGKNRSGVTKWLSGTQNFII